ncbi:MAG: prepilin-type N-terminal cleavage/methylation domain-containing protein [Bdellovibrio sp.]
MRKSRLGFGLVELMVVVGLLSVVSLGAVSLVSNLLKGVASAQRGANRTDAMKSISTALSNKEICKSAMGAGTLAIPPGWAVLPISQIQVGSDILAKVGLTQDGVTITGMKLENEQGPFTVLYNVTTPPAAPVIKNYKRYFAKLTVSAKKKGGAENNVGGETMTDSTFHITFLVDDTNTLFDCFGGMSDADNAVQCENGFDGEYDASKYPWCTPRTLSVGIKQSDMPADHARFTVFEQQSPSNPGLDLTMNLNGNGAGGNGPGLWWTEPSGENAAIGLAYRPAAYDPSSVSGDFVIGNNSLNKDLRVHVTNNYAAGVVKQIPALTIKSDGSVGIGTDTPKATLEVKGGILPGSIGVTTGGGCSPEGAFAYDMSAHAPVYCSATSKWTSMGGAGGSSGSFTSCITVGSASQGGWYSDGANPTCPAGYVMNGIQTWGGCSGGVCGSNIICCK